MYRKIVLGTKLVRRQIGQRSCLKEASDLIGKHIDVLKAMAQGKNVFSAKINSENRELWELRGGGGAGREREKGSVLTGSVPSTRVENSRGKPCSCGF